MTICYFGIYQKDYARNKVLIDGLRQNEVAVLECNSRKKGIKKYIDLCFRHWQIRNKYDVMVIGFLGQGIIKLAKRITKKPIVLDAFVSQYMTNVFDRKLCDKDSRLARKYWQLDKQACEIADLVLLDTDEQIDYFVKEFGLSKEKFRRIFVGSDNEIFKPTSKEVTDHVFTVHFHGYLVPFHGIDTVVEAARILQDKDPKIEFRIVTRFNQAYKKVRKLADGLGIKNIVFHDEVPPEELSQLINQADVCLNVFSNSLKANLVIPNKVYETLACGKPLISAKLKALGELLTDRETVLFCEPNNPEDLAAKILELKDDKELRNKLAENSHRLYLEKLTPKVLGGELVSIISKLQIPISK